MKDADDKKHWIVDGEAAEVVKRIFALCLESYGPTQIARILKEEQVITPTIHFMQDRTDNKEHAAGQSLQLDRRYHSGYFGTTRVSRAYGKLQDL